jgi:hypothetical protein
MIKIDVDDRRVKVKNTIMSINVIKEQPTGAKKLELVDEDGVIYIMWLSAWALMELQDFLPVPPRLPTAEQIREGMLPHISGPDQ